VHPFSRSARRKTSFFSVECPIVIIRIASRKKNSKKVANSWTPKSDRQRTTIYQQLTTTSPQKHHHKTPFFAKTPCKTAPPTTK
jgi:hypothetical protein